MISYFLFLIMLVVIQNYHVFVTVVGLFNQRQNFYFDLILMVFCMYLIFTFPYQVVLWDQLKFELLMFMMI